MLVHPDELIQLSEKYVTSLLHDQLPAFRTFHNAGQTQCVVEKCQEMMKHANLTENERYILLLAAWFHDTGYVYASKHHEELSAGIAGDFLMQFGLPHGIVDDVKNLILETKEELYPSTHAGKILCDADTFYLGSKDFKTRSRLLKKEMELDENISISEEEWSSQSKKLLISHRYFTAYAKSQWEGQKQKNLVVLENQIGARVVNRIRL